LIDACADELLEVRTGGDVGPTSERLAPVLSYPVRDVIEALDAPCAENNFRAALSEQTRSRLADPTACPSDRHDFSLDAGHRRPFVPVPPPRIPHSPPKPLEALIVSSVLIGFLLALGCSVCYGTATVFQAVATRSVEGGSSSSGVDAMLLLRAVRQWRYLAGIGLDCLGFLLQVIALRLVPIYVVAAALAASIAVTGVVSAWVLSARLSSTEWTAVGVVCASLIVLALAAGPAHFRHAPAGLGWALIGVVAAIYLAGAAAGRLSDRHRALALGLASGSGFGVVEIGVRLLDEIDPTKAAFYTNPALYAGAGGGLAGFLLLTSALQRGSVTTTVAAMVVGETIAPALVGVIWLGDTARDGLGWLVIAGFVVAVSGTLVLARFGEAPTPAESS